MFLTLVLCPLTFDPLSMPPPHPPLLRRKLTAFRQCDLSIVSHTPNSFAASESGLTNRRRSSSTPISRRGARCGARCFACLAFVGPFLPALLSFRRGMLSFFTQSARASDSATSKQWVNEASNAGLWTLSRKSRSYLTRFPTESVRAGRVLRL